MTMTNALLLFIAAVLVVPKNENPLKPGFIWAARLGGAVLGIILFGWGSEGTLFGFLVAPTVVDMIIPNRSSRVSA